MGGTLAVDFDKVIHAYSLGWHDGTIYDGPIPGALEGLRTLMETYAVFIHTARNPRPVAEWLAGYDFTCMVEGLVHAPMKFWNERGVLLVTNRKLPALAYLDDRAVRFTSWTAALEELLHGRRTEPAEMADAFARIDARHQPTTQEKWVTCPEHVRYFVAKVTSCPICATRPVTVCANALCPTWPCEEHLALHGESPDTCIHRGGTR